MDATILFLAQLVVSSVIALAIATLYSLVLPGIERKIQARIQQRVGPPILMPGFWSVIKFMYKARTEPIAQMPRFYKFLIGFGVGVVSLLFLFNTPYWWFMLGWGSILGIAGMRIVSILFLFNTPYWWFVLGWGSILGIAGMLKLEEVLYVFMGSQSQSIMSTSMPVPDTVRGSKWPNIRREFNEQHSAERSLKMMLIGSLPLYLALLVPFIVAQSVNIGSVVVAQNPAYSPFNSWLSFSLPTSPILFTVPGFIAATWMSFSLPTSPILFTVPGFIAAIVYFLGFVVMLNEKPFTILKAKIDMIEGGVLEYAANLRAGYYLMRNLLMFALSSIFVTLFLGIPFDPFMPAMFLMNMVLSLILPIALSVLVAFSPIFTFRQIYPTAIGLSALGVLAMILALSI